MMNNRKSRFHIIDYTLLSQLDIGGLDIQKPVELVPTDFQLVKSRMFSFICRFIRGE